MSLAERLLASRQAQLTRLVEQSAPKGWKAGTTTVDGETTVTTQPYMAGDVEPTHRRLLEENGWDPERHRITGPVRQTSWTAYVPKDRQVEGEPYTFMAKAYRFSVVERAEGELSIDELVAVVNKADPFPWFTQHILLGSGSEVASQLTPSPARPIVVPLDSTHPYVLALGDTQIGKKENPTAELLEQCMALLRRAALPLAALAETGSIVEHVHLAWLGDCIEGMNSQGGRLRWRTTLTVTEQVRILRRLMLYAIELLAPLTKRLTVVSIPGNHDEANARDLDTRIDDSWAVEALNMVADAIAYNPEAFGHVECYVPGPDEHAVVMDVGGTIVAHTHGHEHPKGKHFPYWAGQALGGQPMGRAQLWLQGHGHHLQVDEDGQRTWIEVPALERESTWWKRKSGTGGSPGLVTFQLNQGELLNLSKLQPEAAA